MVVRVLLLASLLMACGDSGGEDGSQGGSGGIPAGGTGGTAGGTGGMMAGGTGGAMPAAGSGAPSGPATFTRVFEEVLNAKTCTSAYCHGMGLGNLMMPMDNRDTAYAALVNAPAAGDACGSSGKTRVVPGDPDASLMLEKMNPMPSCGDAMPLGTKFDPDCIIPDNPSVCTTQAELTLVREWIAAGAMND